KRSIPSRLWQVAMMEYGNGELTYDNRTDKHSDGSDGLDNDQLVRVLGGLTGKPSVLYEVDEDARDPAALDRLMEGLSKGISSGKPLVVGLQWGEADSSGQVHGGHQILVTRLTGERVYFDNPWGSEESMSLVDFKKRVTDVFDAGLALDLQKR
ncbi:MAG TPA: hypothetical protein V6C82_00740, partial [Chroococcales cyanobacterium]